MREQKKIIEIFDNDLIRLKIRNFLIFGGEKSGKTSVALEISKLSNIQLITIFTNESNFKKYNRFNISTKFLTAKKLKSVVDKQENELLIDKIPGGIILDECVSDSILKNRSIYKWLALNRIPMISYILTFSYIPVFPPSERYNFDWVCVCGGLYKKEYEKIYDYFGMCFKNFNDFYRLMIQLDERPKGTACIIFKNVYDGDFTKPGPYFLHIKQHNIYNHLITSWGHKVYDKRECAICLDKIEMDLVILRCGHPFHTNCIKGWIKNNNTCPFCRKIIIKNT